MSTNFGGPFKTRQKHPDPFEQRSRDAEFIMGAMEAIGKDRLFAARLKAMQDGSIVFVSAEGTLLGGRLTIQVEFDGKTL